MVCIFRWWSFCALKILTNISVIYRDSCTDVYINFFSSELKETIRNNYLFLVGVAFICSAWLMNHFFTLHYSFKLFLFHLLLTIEHFSSTSSWNFKNRSWTSTSLRKKARKWVKGCFLLKVSKRTSIRVRAEITPLRCWPVITINKKQKC